MTCRWRRCVDSKECELPNQELRVNEICMCMREMFLNPESPRIRMFGPFLFEEAEGSCNQLHGVVWECALLETKGLEPFPRVDDPADKVQASPFGLSPPCVS